MTRVIVSGSRDFNHYGFLCSVMDEILAGITGEVELVSGHARGADILGERYAAERGLRVAVFPADWDLFGKAAGPFRNQRMIDYATCCNALLVAFWDGESRGTMDTIKRAERAGVAIRICREKSVEVIR